MKMTPIFWAGAFALNGLITGAVQAANLPGSAAGESPTAAQQAAAHLAEAHLAAMQRETAHMEAALNALSTAKDFLHKASTGDKGGHVEAAIIKVDLATADLNQGLEFLKAHPEIASSAPAPETSPVRATVVPTLGGANGYPQMRGAIIALNEAIAEMQQTPVGSKDGIRDVILADIDRANAEVVAGIQFAAGPVRGIAAAPLPATRIRTATLPGEHPTPSPTAQPTAEGRLTVVQAALDKAQAALKQTPTNKPNEIAVQGPAQAKGLTDLNQATAQVATGLWYIKAHPEANALAVGPAPADTTMVYLARLPAYIDRNPLGRFTNPAAVEALDALNGALCELTNNPPGGPPGPVLGDLGGSRNRIILALVQVAADIVAGLDYSYDRYQAGGALAPGSASVFRGGGGRD